MSELKARGVDDVYIEYYNTGKHELAQVYLKSEADKVITELKNEIETQKRLRDMALASVPNALKVAKIIQHNKHKRCLAMALVWFERAENSTDWKNELVSRKRFSKWLELAEKFKEAK